MVESVTVISDGRVAEQGLKALRAFAQTYGLRLDWHEPDEQSVTARLVAGQELDNAMGDEPRFFMDEAGSPVVMEHVVIVEHHHTYEDGSTIVDHSVSVNLATLLAAAGATLSSIEVSGDDPDLLNQLKASVNAAQDMKGG